MEKPHKRLNAWKSAMELAVELYRMTDSFPSREAYGLTQQIRRAVTSIPSNIAEGAARQTKKEFVNYLHMVQGSLSELDSQLELANKLGYLKDDALTSMDGRMSQIDKMISGLIQHQRRQYAQREGSNKRRSS
jgi:four helix bundle protein